MAALTVQAAALTGTVLSLAAAAGGGDTFANDGRTVLVVNNGGVGEIDVTIDSPEPCSHGGTHDLVVAVGAGVEKVIGPFPVKRFSSTVSISYEGVTDVTVAARRV